MSELDCKTCGACCIADYDDPAYVDLDEDDVKRLSKRVVRLHVLNYKPFAIAESRPALATKHTKEGHCVCAMLRGTPGKRVSCSVYDARPYACREFRVGGKVCLYAREQLGLPTVTPL